MLVADPQVEDAGEDDSHLLLGVVRVRLGAGAPARFDRRQDHLEPAGHVGGQEFVGRLEPGIGNASACLATHDPAGLRFLGEQLGDRQVEGPGDPLERRDRRARDVTLDLREEALGDARPLRDVAEGQASRLADRTDARPELELGRHGPPGGRFSR
jgi:hypothetical protein